jgi:hypothetical protein
MPWVLVVVAGVTTIALIGGALFGLSLWNAAFAFVLVLALREWSRCRSSVDMTPREAADRIMLPLLVLAIGVASPTFDAFEAWLRAW